MRDFEPGIDYYAALDISPAATPKQITRAYHKLAQRYHPDKHKDNVLEDLAREKLVQLNAAYDVLKDAKKRAAYDAVRRGGPPPPRQANNRQQTSRGRTQVKHSTSGTIKNLVIPVLILVTLPYTLKLISNPKALISIAIFTGLTWLGPRIKSFFKR